MRAGRNDLSDDLPLNLAHSYDKPLPRLTQTSSCLPTADGGYESLNESKDKQTGRQAEVVLTCVRQRTRPRRPDWMNDVRRIRDQHESNEYRQQKEGGEIAACDGVLACTDIKMFILPKPSINSTGTAKPVTTRSGSTPPKNGKSETIGSPARTTSTSLVRRETSMPRTIS